MIPSAQHTSIPMYATDIPWPTISAPTAGPTASASCLTSANAELYCPISEAGARSATSGDTVGDSIDSPTPNSAYVEISSVVATACAPCTSPDRPAASHATVHITPTSAMTRLRRRRSTSLSTTNCAATIAAVFAARAMPSVAGAIRVTSVA